MDNHDKIKEFCDDDTLVIFHVDEVFNKVVKAQGNGAMVTIPKQYLGRRVKVVLLKEDDP